MTTSNALTIDVEDYFHASALGVPASTWGKLEQRAAARTLELLDLLDEVGAKATFFVLGWLADREPGLVRTISDRGHEVACHGYSHQLIYRQTPAEFAAETRRAKTILENAVGQEVRGYRAASFSIVEETRWALDIIADLGFTYDSSIFPIYHDRYGIRNANPRPHLLAVGNGRSLVELPPPVVTLGPLRIPIAGGGYFRLYPYALTRWGICRINRANAPAVVYLHPWEIDVDQPYADVGRLTRFRHYVNIGKTRDRLRRLLADFAFEPLVTIAERYRAAAETGLVGEMKPITTGRA
jgi:polysaccharide deacetylase family protein (PEP-CTERM system associated)